MDTDDNGTGRVDEAGREVRDTRFRLDRVAPALERLRERPTVDVPTAASALGVGHAAVRLAIARGDVPTIQLGRTIRIPSAWILQQLHLD